MSSDEPIFVHSLFRAGSTYIFNAFRHSPAGYWAYQEPFNEFLLNARARPEALLEVGSQTREYLRHPPLDKPYFYEFNHLGSQIARLFRKEFSYDWYFLPNDGTEIKGIKDYLRVLIDGARGRPVFQCCRSAGRVKWLCGQFGGIHIFLWRNPLDQWWSYKADFYFERANYLIANSPYAPQWLKILRANLGLPEFHAPNLDDEISHFNKYKLAPIDSYKLFYALWCHAMLEARPNCDVVINVDLLSLSDEYRREILDELESLGIYGLDFVDCFIPIGFYGNRHIELYKRVEEEIHGLLIWGGYQKELLDEVLSLQRNCLDQVKQHSSRVEILEADVFRLREYFERYERDLAQSRAQQRELERLLDDARKRIEDLSAELGMLREKERELKEKLWKEQEASAELKVRLEDALKQTSVEKARVAELERAKLEADRRREQLSEEIVALRRQLEAVYASYSWRIAYPLRLGLDAL
ncbi:MAG: hypothetical protein QXP27_09210, partial [Candidatus Methanomethyliaceae archaeon]